MLLTDQIEDQNRKQCQQIGGKCQIIICSKLCLEVQLCQRKCISASWTGHDDEWCHYIVPCTKCCQNCNCRMHWFHDWENNLPICFPCARTIHTGCFFQCQRVICQISGIKQYIHRHIKYNVQNNNSCSVCQSHLRRLFYNRHHQNCKWHKHSADNIEINEFIDNQITKLEYEEINSISNKEF